MMGNMNTPSYQDQMRGELQELAHQIEMQVSSVGQSSTVMLPSNPMLLSVEEDQMDTRSLVVPPVLSERLYCAQLNSRMFSATSPIQNGSTSSVTGNSVVCKKKSRKAPGFLPSPSSKKQRKEFGALSDESSKQLNDFLAVTGVDLMKEERSFLSEPKKVIHNSKEPGRLIQEVEDKLILQKIPLQLKLEQIMKRYGLKKISSDVEQCLSECTEERMQGLMANIIRISKQRFSLERHNMSVTSDVRQKIMLISQKDSGECKKKLAEPEKFQIPDAASKEGNEKVPVPMKDKMSMKSANSAIRAALGDDDMLSRWQLKVSQSKGRGLINAVGVLQPRKETGKKGGKSGNSAASTPPDSIKCRTVSVRDVIAALGRES